MRDKKLGRWVVGCATAGLIAVAIMFSGVTGSTLSKSVASGSAWVVQTVGLDALLPGTPGQGQSMESINQDTEWT